MAKKSFSGDLDVAMKEALGPEQKLVKAKFKEVLMEPNVRHAHLWNKKGYDPYDIKLYDEEAIEQMRASFELNIANGESPNDTPMEAYINEDGKLVVSIGNTRTITGRVFLPEVEGLFMIVPNKASQLKRIRENETRTKQGFLATGIGFFLALNEGAPVESIAKSCSKTVAQVKNLAGLVDLVPKAQELCEKVLKEKAAIALSTLEKGMQKKIVKYIKEQDIRKVKDANDVTRLVNDILKDVDDHVYKYYREGFSWKDRGYPALEDEPWVLVLEEGMYTRYKVTDGRKSQSRSKAVYEKKKAELMELYPGALDASPAVGEPGEEGYIPEVKHWQLREKYDWSIHWKEVEKGTHPEEVYVFTDTFTVKVYAKRSAIATEEEKEEKVEKLVERKEEKVNKQHLKKAWGVMYRELQVLKDDQHKDFLDNWIHFEAFRSMVYRMYFDDNFDCETLTAQAGVTPVKYVHDFASSFDPTQDYRKACEVLAWIQWEKTDGINYNALEKVSKQLGNKATKKKTRYGKPIPVLLQESLKACETEFKSEITTYKEKKALQKRKLAEKEIVYRDFAIYGSAMIVKGTSGFHVDLHDLLTEDEGKFVKDIGELPPVPRKEVIRLIAKGTGCKAKEDDASLRIMHRTWLYNRKRFKDFTDEKQQQELKYSRVDETKIKAAKWLWSKSKGAIQTFHSWMNDDGYDSQARRELSSDLGKIINHYVEDIEEEIKAMIGGGTPPIAVNPHYKEFQKFSRLLNGGNKDLINEMWLYKLIFRTINR